MLVDDNGPSVVLTFATRPIGRFGRIVAIGAERLAGVQLAVVVKVDERVVPSRILVGHIVMGMARPCRRIEGDI